MTIGRIIIHMVDMKIRHIPLKVLFGFGSAALISVLLLIFKSQQDAREAEKRMIEAESTARDTRSAMDSQKAMRKNLEEIKQDSREAPKTQEVTVTKPEMVADPVEKPVVTPKKAPVSKPAPAPAPKTKKKSDKKTHSS